MRAEHAEVELGRAGEGELRVDDAKPVGGAQETAGVVVAVKQRGALCLQVDEAEGDDARDVGVVVLQLAGFLEQAGRDRVEVEAVAIIERHFEDVSVVEFAHRLVAKAGDQSRIPRDGQRVQAAGEVAQRCEFAGFERVARVERTEIAASTQVFEERDRSHRDRTRSRAASVAIARRRGGRPHRSASRRPVDRWVPGCRGTSRRRDRIASTRKSGCW